MPRNERARHERLLDASDTKHRAIGSVEPCCSRFRPHESIGDRVPAEAMKEFSRRFGRALACGPEAMEAA